MDPHLAWLDYLVVLAYLLAMVWMGVRFSRGLSRLMRPATNPAAAATTERA